MIVLKMVLHDDNLQRVTDFLKEKFEITYTHFSSDSVVLAFEEYFFRNSSMQFNMLVLKQTSEGIVIEAVGGGGGEGILNFNWGSEKQFVQIAQDELASYAAQLEIQFDLIEE